MYDVTKQVSCVTTHFGALWRNYLVTLIYFNLRRSVLSFFMIFSFKTKNLLTGVAVFANIPWRDFPSAYTHVISRCHRFEVKGCQVFVHQDFRL
jgi:hypothetical protein